MTPASSIHKGFTLVELIILIVVISAALVGVLIGCVVVEALVVGARQRQAEVR